MSIIEPTKNVHPPALEIEKTTEKVTILQLQGKATRNDPVQGQLVKAIKKSAESAGNISRIEIFSGGQESAAEINSLGVGGRVGSDRHDHGNAADFRVFDLNGKLLAPASEKAIPTLSSFVSNMRKNGITGIGAGRGYMGGMAIHAGYGSTTVWGANGKSANAPAWLRQSFYSANPNTNKNNRLISDRDRDLMIRTIIGEAAGESSEGQAAVAHVILNRANSSRHGNTIEDVVLAPAQFSAWNAVTGGAGGSGANNLVRSHGPDSDLYKSVGNIVDGVTKGSINDPSGGATHYFSPAGMTGRRAPDWWTEESQRGGGAIKIGGHIFAGNPDLVGKNQATFNFDTGNNNISRGEIAAREQQYNRANNRENTSINNNSHLNAENNRANFLNSFLQAQADQAIRLDSGASIIQDAFSQISQQTSNALETAEEV